MRYHSSSMSRTLLRMIALCLILSLPAQSSGPGYLPPSLRQRMQRSAFDQQALMLKAFSETGHELSGEPRWYVVKLFRSLRWLDGDSMDFITRAIDRMGLRSDQKVINIGPFLRFSEAIAAAA